MNTLLDISPDLQLPLDLITETVRRAYFLSLFRTHLLDS